METDLSRVVDALPVGATNKLVAARALFKRCGRELKETRVAPRGCSDAGAFFLKRSALAQASATLVLPCAEAHATT